MTIFWLVAGGVFLIDVLTKVAIRQALPLGAELHLTPFFSIVHVENTGIAFGLFQNNNMVFLVLGLIVLAVLVWMGRQILTQDLLSGYGLAVVVGGAFGNILDRLMRGRVTDFLDFYWGSVHWPAFNVADSAICLGAALLLWRGFYGSHTH